MKRVALTIAFVFVLVPALFAGVPGSFRGVVVTAPRGEKASGWIYLKGPNGMVRRVAVARAKVSYSAKFPVSERNQKPELGLVPGAEVRVTALVGNDGEWSASRIEILGHRRVDVYGDEDDDDENVAPMQNVVTNRAI